MRKSVAELNCIPNEFQEGSAPELPPLPDEFNRFTPPTKDDTKDRRKRLRKMLMILAAAGVILFGGVSAKPQDAEQPVSEAELPAAPTPFAEQEKPPASVSPTATPAVQETLAPTSEPTPEPEPTPDVEPIFFYTHSVANAAALLSDPAHTVSVHVDVRVDLVNDSLLIADLTDEDVAKGVWEMYGIDMNEFLYRHREVYEEPDSVFEPVMYVMLTYRMEDGTEGTVVRTATPTSEDYVDFDYFDDSYIANDWTYPGCFTASVYDARHDTMRFTTDPDHKLQPGEVFISVTVNGMRIPEENCYVKRIDDMYEFEGETFISHTFIFVMQKPDSFPEHGTAHVTVRQKLMYYDFIREKEYEIGY